MKKKLLTMILAVCVVGALIGCGKKEPETVDVPEVPEVSEVAEDTTDMTEPEEVTETEEVTEQKETEETVEEVPATEFTDEAKETVKVTFGTDDVCEVMVGTEEDGAVFKMLFPATEMNAITTDGSTLTSPSEITEETILSEVSIFSDAYTMGYTYTTDPNDVISTYDKAETVENNGITFYCNVDTSDYTSIHITGVKDNHAMGFIYIADEANEENANKIVEAVTNNVIALN